jgi:hypothetical protein
LTLSAVIVQVLAWQYHASEHLIASCLWQQRAKKGLAFTEKRDNLQSVLGILNSKEDMEADSNQNITED